MDRSTQRIVVLDQLPMVAFLRRSVLTLPLKLIRGEKVSGHSFRAGHVSQAVRNGVPEYVVMKQTGHKSREVLGAYIRTGEMFEQNAASGLWAA